MLRLPTILALLALLLGGCSSSPTFRFNFPVPETALNSGPGQTPLHGVTTQVGGQISVFVGSSRTPQVLSLMSFSSTIWHVYLFPGANVTKIYVAGFDQQEVVIQHSRADGAAVDPEVANLSGNLIGHHTLSFGPPTQVPGRRMEDYKSELRTETGLELTGFAGIYNPALNDAFAVSMPKPPTAAEIAEHFPHAVHRDRTPATEDFEEVRSDLITLVERRILPAQMPLFENTERSDDQVRHWALLPDDPPSTECGRIAIGSASDDALSCGDSDGYIASTEWIIAGSGCDLVADDDELSQVLSGGPGDDIINAGLGNDVIYFGRNWGHDDLTLRCLSAFDDASLPAYQNNRYIVFGSGVRPANLRWVNDKEIEDVATGSRIRFTDEMCAKFVAVEQGEIPAAPPGQARPMPPVVAPRL